MGDLSNFPTVGLINEALIGSLISAIKSDGGALEFCDIMESLVDNASSKMDIEVLRNGKSRHIDSIHIYMHLEVGLKVYICISNKLMFFHLKTRHVHVS